MNHRISIFIGGILESLNFRLTAKNGGGCLSGINSQKFGQFIGKLEVMNPVKLVDGLIVDVNRLPVMSKA